jgi:hypothetical protein
MGLDHSCAVGRHTYEERGHDLYNTSPVAVPPLLTAEYVPPIVFEPSAGEGYLVRALQASGRRVVTADLIDHGFPLDYQEDFLARTEMPPGVTCILTNPPFKIVEEYIANAIEICPLVIVLLRLAFFEAGSGKQKKHQLRRYILDEKPPARIHVFRKRLPMMHRKNWDGEKTNSGMAFAWWTWSRGHVGPITIDRISWEC